MDGVLVFLLFFSAKNRYLFYDSNCDGDSGYRSFPQWGIYHEKPSITQLSDLDSNGKCLREQATLTRGGAYTSNPTYDWTPSIQEYRVSAHNIHDARVRSALWLVYKLCNAARLASKTSKTISQCGPLNICANMGGIFFLCACVCFCGMPLRVEDELRRHRFRMAIDFHDGGVERLHVALSRPRLFMGSLEQRCCLWRSGGPQRG